MEVANTEAYYDMAIITAVRIFIVQASDLDSISGIRTLDFGIMMRVLYHCVITNFSSFCPWSLYYKSFSSRIFFHNLIG